MTTTMELFLMSPGFAVCSNPGGRFHGWLFQQHADGHWVSVMKLDPVPLPPDPLTQSAGRAIASPAVQLPQHMVMAVAHRLMNEFDMRIGSGASKCHNAAREIVDLVTGRTGDGGRTVPLDPAGLVEIDPSSPRRHS